MADKKISFLFLAIAATFVLIFFTVSAQSAALVTDSVITKDQFKAFFNLANGFTKWPVWKVETGSITVDGVKNETVWSNADPIYITGQWMWNKEYRNYSEAWFGIKDCIAVWRLLYDTQNLYVLCEYYDDIHNEGGIKQVWNGKADGVELTVVKPGCTVSGVPVDSIILRTIAAMQIQRRFTAQAGMLGKVMGMGSYGLETLSVAATDGDAKLAGILMAAKPNSNVPANHSAPWIMEIKIPLCNIQPIGSGIGPVNKDGTVFRMNLKITDADSITVRTPALSFGMERYERWYMKDSMKIYDPLPEFILAGSKSVASTVFTFPDEKNLYCGATPELYDSLINSGFYSTAVEGMHLPLSIASGFSIQPNPMTSAAYFKFESGGQRTASFDLFDIRGARVAELGAVRTAFLWNGRNTRGEKVAPGAYVIRMTSGRAVFTKPLTIMK